MTCVTGNVLANSILILRHPVVDIPIYRILKDYCSPTAMQPTVKDFNIMFLWSCDRPSGPAAGHLDTGFSWFPCAEKQMMRWLPLHASHIALPT